MTEKTNQEERIVKLTIWSNIATIAGSIGTCIAIIVGVWQFSKTQVQTREALQLQLTALNDERESDAVDLIIKYNEVMKDYDTTQQSTKRSWQDNLAVNLAEAIFKLKKDDSGWINTVKWMLSNHYSYIQSGIDISTYDADFVKLITNVKLEKQFNTKK